MSILDAFVRMRLYRKRAAEFEQVANASQLIDVQRRYRAIANHYRLLADCEERSERARAVGRLTNLKERGEGSHNRESSLSRQSARKIAEARIAEDNRSSRAAVRFANRVVIPDATENAVRNLLKHAAENADLRVPPPLHKVEG